MTQTSQNLINPQLRLKNLCAQKSRIWMGIINLSPQSFSFSKSTYPSHNQSFVEQILRQSENFLKKGADILDIGAVPTNPAIKNALVDPQDELKILCPVLYAIRKEFGSLPLISIDTYSPTVAHALAKENLIDIVNDVCGGKKIENEMSTLDIVSKFSLGYVLMHMSGELETLNIHANTTEKEDLNFYLDSLLKFFQERKEVLEKKGISFCVFDPGIGGGRFGKNLEQILGILSEEFLKQLADFNFPLLVGLSRKSFLEKLYPKLLHPHERDAVSKEWEHSCFERGVRIIRTHVL